jgi:penicillin-binding protein 2
LSVIEAHSALRPRITFFYVVIAGIVAVLIAGLAWRQLFSNEAYAEHERRQNQRRVLIPGPRGEIFDREGRVLVANRPRFAAVIYFSDSRLRSETRTEQFRLTRQINQESLPRPPEGIAARARLNIVQRYLDQCARILGRTDTVDPRALERHFSQQPMLPFPLVNDLAPPEFARLVEQLPLGSPVQIHASTTRHYPYGNAAAHTLGFVASTLDIPAEGLPGADLMTFFARGTLGRDGLERSFDDRLQGRTGTEIWIVDNNGVQARLVENQAPVSGNSIFTSLDVDAQLAGEEAFGDKEGALVLLDVRTGEVLALVSRPGYDLNELTPFISRATWNRIDERGAWLNRATQGYYPPGSTFKLVTAIAALRAGAITPETEAVCTGELMVGRVRFVCHNHNGHGRVRLVDAIRQSCNVYFYQAALAAGAEAVAQEARRFGLDRPTGIELPNEGTRMIVPDNAWKRARTGEGWSAGDTANMAIGQGFLRVTPMQMACMVASLARGETITRPTLLRREGRTSIPVSGNQLLGLAPDQRAALYEGMAQVVRYGTGRLAALPGITLGGKSGTAQVETPRGTLELAWFVACGPVENPAVAIALVVVGDEPDRANAGGKVAAPIAKKVLEAWFAKHPPRPPSVLPLTPAGGG